MVQVCSEVCPAHQEYYRILNGVRVMWTSVGHFSGLLQDSPLAWLHGTTTSPS